MDDEQAEIMRLMEPYFSRVFPRFPAALKLYNEEYPASIRAEHDDRAAASSIWCHIHKEFQREFINESGFHFLDYRGLHVVNVNDQMVWRYKKVDQNGRHRNSRTKQQQEFDSQKELPGLPPKAVRLVIGYQPDVALSVVERVTVRRPNGHWVSQILEEDDACSWADITPVELPFGQRRERREEAA